MTKKFEPTEKQLAKWTTLKPAVMPTDEEFKETWKKQHHGKITGWGMGKRDWIILHSDDNITCTLEYQIGLWQGRIDAMNGEAKAETPNKETNPYEYGYNKGYDTFESFWNGYDRNARAELLKKYGKE